jgi:hypothetical protein
MTAKHEFRKKLQPGACGFDLLVSETKSRMYSRNIIGFEWTSAHSMGESG